MTMAFQTEGHNTINKYRKLPFKSNNSYISTSKEMFTKQMLYHWAMSAQLFHVHRRTRTNRNSLSYESTTVNNVRQFFRTVRGRTPLFVHLGRTNCHTIRRSQCTADVLDFPHRESAIRRLLQTPKSNFEPAKYPGWPCRCKKAHAICFPQSRIVTGLFCKFSSE